MEGLGISIGEILAEAIVPMIEKLAKLAGKLNKMSPSAKRTAVVFGLILAAIGPLMFLIGGLIRNFVLLRAVMIKSNITTKTATALQRIYNMVLRANPIGLVITAVVGLVAAFTLLNKKKKEAVVVEKKLTEGAREDIAKTKLRQSQANKLIETIKDQNISNEQRSRLIKRLNTEYKDFLPNLIGEKDSVEDITKAQKEMNNQMAKKVVMIAAQDQLAEASKKAVEAMKKMEPAQKRLDDAMIAYKNSTGETITAQEALRISTTEFSNPYRHLAQEILNANSEFKTQEAIVEGSQREMARFAERIDEVSEALTGSGNEASGTGGKIDGLGNDADGTTESLTNLANIDYDGMNQSFHDIEENLNNVTEDAEEFDHSFRKAYETAKMFAVKYKELGNEIANVMHRTSIDTIAGMAEIAGAMVMGEASFKDLGSFLLGQFAGLLAQLGKLLIQYGIGIEAFVNALKLGPTPMAAALAVGAGVAMIAAAGAIRASISKAAGGDIPAMAEGGIVTGPTLALIGEGRESEAVIPLSKLNTMMQGGGGQNVVVTGRISGADILLSNERASRNRTRQRGF